MNTVTLPAVNVADTKVRAKDLSSVLDRYQNQINILSLDCFDTLLWRDTAVPVDVFFDLQHRPTFKSTGLSALMRIRSETKARKLNFYQRNSFEVTLNDIYLANFPHLSQQELTDLAEEELNAEINACYGFPPVIELIRSAHQRGIKIIIVSDTYLTEVQLRHLLSHKLPTDVMAAIDKIFCSCEMGKSKSRGLFQPVIDKLQAHPQTILHIGDNVKADFTAPSALGINALHLVQNDLVTENMLRLQALSACFIDSSFRSQRPLPGIFKGLLAAAPLQTDKPETIIGYLAAGPIMYAFAKFIHEEVEQMKRAGKAPKVLFLMRDGFLPSLVCEALAGQPIGHRVRISRFASLASSFCSIKDIDDYLIDVISSSRFDDICHQLLLPEKMAKRIVNQTLKSQQPREEFRKLIHEKKIIELIIQKSSAYRSRLKRHITNAVSLESGDTLVLVDLGYTGTTQMKLEPIFRDEMNIAIHGLYLIQLRTPGWEKSRKGLLDPSWCDERTMQSIVAYVALLEQICTANEKSAVDYDDQGNPIYSETSVSKQQYGKLDLIQAECIRFTQDAEKFFKAANLQPKSSMLRDTAAAELVRLLFFPTEQELQYLQTFQFELNMGTKDILQVFNHEAGLTGLRRRGLFFMEKNLKTMRTNYPAELRFAGMELSLTLLAQHRFSLDIGAKDWSYRREQLQIIVIRGNESSKAVIDAEPTFDGCFSLLIPVGTGNFQIGILFGANYKWIQIESTQVIKGSALLSQFESQNTTDVSANIISDQMTDNGGGLFECLSESSLFIFAAPQQLGNDNYILRVVFRPLVPRVSQTKEVSEQQ